MTVSAATPGAAGALFARRDLDVERQALDQRVHSLESRLGDTDRLLSLPRGERRHQVSPELYTACWNASTKTHSAVAAHLCIFAAAAGGVAAMLTGVINPAIACLGAGALGGLGYVYAVKHLVLPRQVDKKMVVPALQRERASLAAALDQAKAARASFQERERAEIVEQVQKARAEAPAPIQVEEASVVIGGVRIPIRKGD